MLGHPNGYNLIKSFFDIIIYGKCPKQNKVTVGTPNPDVNLPHYKA